MGGVLPCRQHFRARRSCRVLCIVEKLAKVTDTFRTAMDIEEVTSMVSEGQPQLPNQRHCKIENRKKSNLLVEMLLEMPSHIAVCIKIF